MADRRVWCGVPSHENRSKIIVSRERFGSHAGLPAVETSSEKKSQPSDGSGFERYPRGWGPWEDPRLFAGRPVLNNGQQVTGEHDEAGRLFTVQAHVTMARRILGVHDGPGEEVELSFSLSFDQLHVG